MRPTASASGLRQSSLRASLAISADGGRWAFILKQPSLALGESRYGLYLGAGDREHD